MIIFSEILPNHKLVSRCVTAKPEILRSAKKKEKLIYGICYGEFIRKHYRQV